MSLIKGHKRGEDRYQTLEETGLAVVAYRTVGSMPHPPVVPNHMYYQKLLLVSLYRSWGNTSSFFLVLTLHTSNHKLSL